MFELSRIAAVLVATIAVAGCGGDGPSDTTSSGSSSSSSSSGGDAAPPADVHWTALPIEGAPSARYLHTAVWTGSKMLIWGGLASGKVTATGAAYDPATKTWSPIATTGAPAARHSHTAVWSGSRMIVWGGFGDAALAPAGALYDPATDTWTPMATAGQPGARTLHSAVWTGARMIVWGGSLGSQAAANGGLYDPAADTWTPVAAAGAPSVRFSHSAVWTGSRMIVWGGADTFDWLSDGAIFDPAMGAGGTWIGPTSASGAPSSREGATAVWTSERMLIWGGWRGGPYEDTGALFDPAAGTGGTWLPMTSQGAPSARGEHVGVWTGNDLLVWGGCGGDLCGKLAGDGARFAPGGGWGAIEAQDALPARRGATGVFTGTSVLIWGGRADGTPLDTGAEGPI